LTSTERVQQFRARNPGYDRRWKSRKRGKPNARLAVLQAQAAAAAAAVAPAKTPMLLLPAPVQDPMMAEMDALAASLAARKARDSQLPQSAPLLPAREAA
jgi:hypothetical protein